MATRVRIIVLLLLIPLSVTSTPPSLFIDIFEVSGTLARPGGSLADHAIVLVRNDYCENGTTWCRNFNCYVDESAPYGPYTATTLTRDDGRFALRVAFCDSYALDTMAVAVVYPDTMIVGDSFVPGNLSYTSIKKTGHRDNDGIFCGGEDYEYEAGRIHQVSNLTVTVP